VAGPRPSSGSWWRSALIFVATAGFGVAAVLNLLSWTPIDPTGLTPVWLADFVLIFIVWCTAVVSLRAMVRAHGSSTHGRRWLSTTWVGSRYEWNSWRDVLGPRPAWFIVVVVLLVTYVFVAFFAAFVQLPGSPEIDGGRYFFDNHGSLIPTNLAGYLEGMRVQMRIFTGHTMLFLGAGALVLQARGRPMTLTPGTGSA
jgi:hypothetical protein